MSSAVRHGNLYYTYWGGLLVGGKPKKSSAVEYAYVLIQVPKATGLAQARYATTLEKAAKILNSCDRADYKHLALNKIHPVSLDDFRTKETPS